MFTQKLYKTGNSVAITIPKQLLEELNLKEGSEVVLEKKGDNIAFISRNAKLASDVTPEFMKMVNDFIDRNEDMLKELSKR